MLNKLTYKKKNLLLILIALLTAVIVYFFAIKKTIAVYHEFTVNKGKMEQAANAPLLAAQLEKELTVMDSKMASQNNRQENVDDAVLSLITTYCQNHHAVLLEFPETTYMEDGNLSIETRQFRIGGDFFTLINLVYLLEQKYNMGKLVSVNYQLKKDFKTKEMQLSATISLQNIKKKNHEN